MFRKIPIFWQLYLSIVCGLFAVVAVGFVYFVYHEEQTAIEDFFLDTELIANQVLRLKQQQKWDQNQAELIADLTAFRVYDVAPERWGALQQKWENVESLSSGTVYDDPDRELLIAVFSIPGSDNKLIIEDMEETTWGPELSAFQQKVQSIEQKEESQLQLAINLIAVGILLVIATVLLALVYRLNRHIDGLIQTSEAWGQGNFQVRANTDSPKPLGGLAASLNTMATELHDIIEDQKVMMHAVSHELRNPLNAFELALELLRRKHPQLSDEPLMIDLGKYADELNYLTNDVLNLAKLMHRKTPLNKALIPFKPLLEERTKSLLASGSNIDVTLDVSDEVHITADPVFLRLALDNLLSNAFKYATSKVEVRYTKKAGESLIVISDDGPGIDSAQYQQALQPFARLDESRNKQTGGFGLGLAIANASMEKHQGALILSKTKSGGLTATLSLPD